MRLLIAESRPTHAIALKKALDEGGALSVTEIARHEERVVFLVHSANDCVQPIAGMVRQVPETRLSLLPHEVMLLTSDDHEGRRQRQETAPRSTVEVYLRGLKAIGSWSSFMAYAVLAGALAWVALWQSSVFLLVGAVLVAPYPSPALGTGLATACGDARLLGRSVLRYFTALLVGVVVAWILTLVAGLPMPTVLMQSVSFVSATTVLLPLCAGVAGGLYLSQSEESSLISAVAAGVLVTAALVPPVGVIGMSAALGEWDMARRALFLLLLQIVAINVAAPLTLWAYRIRPDPAWIDRGRRSVAAASLVTTLLLLGGLMAWQFASPPSLTRATVALEAQGVVADAVDAMDEARLVTVDVRFAKARPGEPDLLLGSVYVRPSDPTADTQRLGEAIQRRLQQEIQRAGMNVVPLVTVTVVRAPGRELL